MSDIVISVKNVSKCYRVFDDQRSRLLHALWPKHTKGMQENWALKDISFEIKRGESVAIIGRNGGGKSTLLEILTGTLTPTAGEVKVNGRVSALLELGSGFNPEYSGRDNVILNGLLLGLSKEAILSRFDEIEAFAEIGAAIDRPVKTYSSGMMMRLAFAVQVLCDPDILIIDEALSVGDFFFQQKCMRYIRGLCDKGVTLLFVSHDMGAVRDVCKRGIFLNKGRVVFDGDNLEAIRLYLQPTDPAPNSVAKDNLHASGVGWLLNKEALDAKKSKSAYLLSAGMFDLYGVPIASARLNSEVIIRARYKCSGDIAPHVHVVIKNKYDQIITAVGSHSMGVTAPKLGSGQEATFELQMRLALEGGSYAYNVSLSIPSLNGVGGELIDESPWVGPFQIYWNYEKEIPPFYGLAGMESTARFIV